MAAESILDRIMVDVRREIADAKSNTPLSELEARLPDLPPVRPFGKALADGFGLIAEIKVKSPSMGMMREANVADAPDAYRDSRAVKAVSLLTQHTHFGMNIRDLQRLSAHIGKPALRKDFIVDPYQIVEARVYGADAILLMSQHLGPEEIRPLADKAAELGLDVLLECYTPQHIANAPDSVRIVGINSRSFSAGGLRYRLARLFRKFGAGGDFTTDLGNFENIRHIPAGKISIAESGISPGTLPRVQALGFSAALIGTSLLTDPRGLRAPLEEFEAAIPS